MKKYKTFVISLLFSLLLTVPMCIFDAAAQGNGDAPMALEDAQTHFVTDAAGILTKDERYNLETFAQEIQEERLFDVCVVTVDDYEDIPVHTSVYETAKYIHKTYEMGYGDGKDCILLLLSMKDRDYALIAYGYGNTVFTDSRKDAIEDEFLSDFRRNDWYSGLWDYFAECDHYLKLSGAGDGGKMARTLRLISVVVSLLLGAIVSAIIVAILKSSMRSVHMKARADEYLTPGSVNFTDRKDWYVRTVTSREKIESDKSDRGGGGTTIDSDGYSGHSGKF